MFFFKTLWRQVTSSLNLKLWLWAGLTSIVFLGFVIQFIDWQELQKVIQNISIPFFILAMIVLSLEGIFTALRMQAFTDGSKSFISCLQVIAWFVVLLIMLPARLGEVAIIFLMGHFLQQNKSSALINAFTQRLLDLLVLTSFFLIFTLGLTTAIESIAFTLSALIFILILTLAIVFLKPCLNWLSKKIAKPIETFSLRDKLVNSLHLAVIWQQEHLTYRLLIKGFLLSIAKWMCNLGGISLLLVSFNLPLETFMKLFLAAAYNFLAVIPLQSIGGFGINEAGLMGLLTLFSIDINLAASISILMRLTLIANPFIFWSLVFITVLMYKKNTTNKKKADLS